MALDDSLGICGLIASLLVSVSDDDAGTISGAADCCFGMFDLSGILVIVTVGVVGLDFFCVATMSVDNFKDNVPTIGVTILGMLGGGTLVGVLTRGGTTVGAGKPGETPDAFKGLLLFRGVCFVRGDDAFGDALTGVVDDGVSIVRGSVSVVSFDNSEEVFGFGEVGE